MQTQETRMYGLLSPEVRKFNAFKTAWGAIKGAGKKVAQKAGTAKNVAKNIGSQTRDAVKGQTGLWNKTKTGAGALKNATKNAYGSLSKSSQNAIKYGGGALAAGAAAYGAKKAYDKYKARKQK